MNSIGKQEITAMIRAEEIWKSRHPEPSMHPWPFQAAIDLLVAREFVVKDDSITVSRKRQVWRDGQSFYHFYYVWTFKGKKACFRSAYTTPMSGAEDIHVGRTRHRIVCECDCYYKKVWVQTGAFRCVCMACGGKGHGLHDLK